MGFETDPEHRSQAASADCPGRAGRPNCFHIGMYLNKVETGGCTHPASLTRPRRSFHAVQPRAAGRPAGRFVAAGASPAGACVPHAT